ncbi:MAG TPA: hypothetical protein ENN07_08515 [candidate division Zixibacteria bacterium]|nr:hypothetical protein [candidate division Zixibacteria bacterium]
MLNIEILDHCTNDFRPITLTRPVASMLAGCFTFEDRVRLLFPDIDVRVRPCCNVANAYFARNGAQSEPDASDGATLYLAPNVVFNLEFARFVRTAEGDAVFDVNGAVVGILTDKPFDEGWFDNPPDWPRHQFDLIVIPAIWDLVNINGRIIEADFGEHFRRAVDGEVHANAAVYGGNAVAVEHGAEVLAGAVLDASDGPIIVARGAKIRPGAMLEGPCYIGPETVIMSGWIRENCSFGPLCKIGGEVESSIFIGYSNKCHEGFVGHSYIGSWVNLGALTTTSDLKNNYGEIRVDLGCGAKSTGRIKVGSFIGDHSKTGIGALLNSGTVIGVAVNHYGAGLPPKNIKSFSWGTAEGYVEHDFDRAVDTARTVTSRRGFELLPEEFALLKLIHDENWKEK